MDEAGEWRGLGGARESGRSDRRPWTPARIREVLDREGLRHEDLTLAFGLSTGDDDRPLADPSILPEDLTGKTVLDIGCRLGGFAFEAARRGAERVVGLDPDPEAIRKARILNDIKGTRVEFAVHDLERDPLPGLFDYLLCLNVLHRLRDPIAAVDRIAAAATERIVLEMSAFGGSNARQIAGRKTLLSWITSIFPVLPFLLRRLPVVLLGAEQQNFEGTAFFSEKAIERLLLTQRGCFKKISFRPTARRDRFVAVAEKLQIDELVVLAGPSGAGKSFLIRELIDGRNADLAASLGIASLSGWELAYPNRLGSLPAGRLKRVLFHYDFLRPYEQGRYEHHRDRSLDILGSARHVRTVTLFAPAQRLAEQFHAREIRPKTLLGRFWGRQRHMRKYSAYCDPAKTQILYDRWFDFVRRLPGSHFVLDVEDGMSLVPLETWTKRLAPAFRPTNG